LNVDLLLPGEGTTDLQKAVKRWTAPEMLKHRLNYVTPPTTTSKDDDDAWEPPNHCAWVDDNRIEEITNIANTPSKLGDVSRIRRTPTVKETAPALEDCKPLEVNDGTRWKSKVFDGQNKSEQAGAGDGEVAAVSDDAILKKALLILNKLSLTKFEKLSEEFVNTGIGQNGTTLSGAVNMIVDKAQSEPHFASMYAQLCLYLSKVPMDESVGGKKAFKKLLLSRCQAEFEEEMSTKIIKAMEGITDVDEQAYHEGLLKKKYLGHMRFIGELYKGDLIKLEVMLFCLNTLLLDEHEHDDHTENHNQHYYDEEKVECFAKLITTVGFPLEQQSYMYSQAGKPNPQAQLDACWHKVESIAQQQETSARIKFMLLDLKEMKNNGM
jgi:translation initiation factor 4G